jgi:hypothetical protein
MLLRGHVAHRVELDIDRLVHSIVWLLEALCRILPYGAAVCTTSSIHLHVIRISHHQECYKSSCPSFGGNSAVLTVWDCKHTHGTHLLRHKAMRLVASMLMRHCSQRSLAGQRRLELEGRQARIA